LQFRSEGDITVAIMMRVIALALAGGVAVVAQTPYQSSIRPAIAAREIPINQGSAALWQSLRKLHTRASIMMVTAHPDDEDGGMLAYESRGVGARVALLTLNRGEGGANVMSNDYFDALGLVRTMELLSAGRYYGVDQYWTRVIDYGFSKTKAESISHWTHDRVLADVVRVVRMVRPLVITSVFVGGPSDGHGNHQTAGAMAQEAFRAAGDPNMFPEQIQVGLHPWSPVKDYARGGGGGRRGGGDTLTVNVTIPQGTYDPVLGASYTQIAREGLGFQKTQNGGPSIPRAGETSSAYHRYASAIAAQDREESFFDGIDTSLGGIATLAKGGNAIFLASGLREINARVEEATAKFAGPHPEACAAPLAAGMKATIALIDAVRQSSLSADARYDILHELEIKRAQFNNALAEALGLTVSASVAPLEEPQGGRGGFGGFGGETESSRVAIPGQTFGVRVHAVSQAPGVKLERLSVQTDGARTPWSIAPAGNAAAGDLAPNKPAEMKFSVAVPANAEFTRPYFTRPDLEQSYYDITDDRFLNQPLAPYPVAGWAEFTFDGAPIRIGQYVQTMKRVAGLGSVEEPLVTGPAIGVEIAPRAGVVPLDAKSFPVTVVVHSNVKGAATGSIRLDLPSGWRAAPATAPFNVAADGQEQSATFAVTPANLAAKQYVITAVAEHAGRQYREGYDVTGYAGVMPYYLYKPSTYKTTGVDVKIAPGLKVAYVMGTGDDVPASLEHLGIKVTNLAPADIGSRDLSKFDVVLLGVRTYAAREDLRANNKRLLDYVNAGGVVIVQYNTPEFDHNYGPYPYTMGRNPEEVTDEAGKVEILAPANPIFNWPNKITAKDFEGWVEERGSKWMRTWDPRYEALLEAHDEGQEPQKGGLLFARFGKGVYIYNAYAFYRQLPEGVPGAYRIFANMLSVGKAPR
jgi:LmbE family N-acetylglucosaminyl deacetylase